MTVEEKAARIRSECIKHPLCSTTSYNCPLYSLSGACYEDETLVERNYNLMFQTDKVKDNPYWNNITAIADKQRRKGLREYGQGIEDNPAAVLDRLRYIEEELVDALMYLEWLREGIANEKDS